MINWLINITRRSLCSALLLILFFSCTFQISVGYAENLPPKILIFYSSIGMGHISASRAIEQKIKERDPKAIVILKNIRDFMPKWKEHIDEKLFWFVVKQYPNLFDSTFRKSMAHGNKVQSLTEIRNSYNTDDVYQFITNVNPTAIIATHYGSAKLLGDLREKGKLSHIPIGWLHTDYFEGYFPRISDRIEMTFLGMPQMATTWLSRGIDPAKVISTGLPVNPALFIPIDRDAFLTSKGLDPGVTTIVLASGGEGVGDFPLIVKEVFAKVSGPIQFIAVCANNEKHFIALNNMAKNLRSDSKLIITKRIPNEELLSYIKASDLFITKSGGLSPTEGFAITKPMILLDVYGGHERDNADLFEKEGFALVNRDQSKIGIEVVKVLNDKTLQEQMVQKQLAFRNSFNLDAITDFAFNPTTNLNQEFNFGVEGGQSVANADEALNQLEKDSPADVEILLSYGKSHEGNYFSGDSNPFGHLALRIGPTVFTANGRAERGIEPQLLHRSSLKEYLFGVNRPYQNVEHTDAFGSSFGRQNISLRVRGLTPANFALMNKEIELIESEWASGTLSWNARLFNCADFVARILKAGGFTPATILKMGEQNKGKEITMPLDVFEAFRQSFESNPATSTEVVMYSAVPGTKNVYKTTRFPLSINQISRSLMNALTTRPDKVEKMVGKVIEVPPGSTQVVYRNENQVSFRALEVAAARFADVQSGRQNQLLNLEQKIEALNLELNTNHLKSSDLLKEIQKNRAMEPSRVLEAKDPEAKALLSKIQQWDDLQTKLESATDQMIQLESDYLIDETLFVLSLTHQTFIASGVQTNLEQYQKLMNEAKVQHRTFKEARINYGGPKDGPTRTVAFRHFFQIAKQLMTLQDIEGLYHPKSHLSFLSGFSKKTQKRIAVAKLAINILPDIINLLTKIGEQSTSSVPNTKATAAINYLARKVAQQLGIRVKIKDSELLPKSGPLVGNKVYLVTPTHRDPLLDTLVMGQLALDNSLLVLATDQFVTSKAVADRMDQTDSLITVGRGSGKPIAKILKQLAKGTSNTILIYPEGSVSIGLSETRPLRERFATGLIESLQSNGYEVVVVPVTYENTSQFVFSASLSSLLENMSTNGGLELIAQVHPAIEDSTIQLLTATTGSSKSLNRMIRSIWLEHLPTNQDRIVGTLRPDAALSLLKTVIKTPPAIPTRLSEQVVSCQELLKAN